MRYYCHNCRSHITSSQLGADFTCPSCRSGFIEELPDDVPTQSSALEDVLYDFITGVPFGSQFLGDISSSSSTSSQTNAPQSGSASSSFDISTSGPDRLINLDFPAPFLQLNSNIGDYAWGNAGFDAVITQLLNNLDGSSSGPPPMPKEQMDALPTFKISDEHINSNNSQCTVCTEDFKIDETARRLPCDHYFHHECIVPWLKLHASCPICRKTFSSQGATTPDNSNSPYVDQGTSGQGRRVYLRRRNHGEPGGSATGSSRATDGSNSGATSTASRESDPSTSRNPNVNLREEDCD